MVVVANADHVGRAHNPNRFRANASGALRRAFSVGRGRSGIFPRRDCLPLALVHLSRSGQGSGAIYGCDSDRLHSWRTASWRDSRRSLVRDAGLALVVFARGRAGDLAWNHHAVRFAGSAQRSALACA